MASTASMRIRKMIATAVALTMCPVASNGCVSVALKKIDPPAGASLPTACSFEGRLFERPSDAKTDSKSARSVTWKLFLAQQSNNLPLREGTGSVWKLTDLPAGKYRLSVSWGGAPQDMPSSSSSGSKSERFVLEPGDSVSATVFVRAFPTGAVIGGVIVVGVLVGVGVATRPSGSAGITGWH